MITQAQLDQIAQTLPLPGPALDNPEGAEPLNVRTTFDPELLASPSGHIIIQSHLARTAELAIREHAPAAHYGQWGIEQADNVLTARILARRA